MNNVVPLRTFTKDDARQDAYHGIYVFTLAVVAASVVLRLVAFYGGNLDLAILEVAF